MTIDTKDMLNSILSSIARIDYVKPEDIPILISTWIRSPPSWRSSSVPPSAMKRIRS